MNIRKRNKIFGKYPSCDFINNAIRYLIKGEIDSAIIELYYAITKADGYFYDDIKEEVQKRVGAYWKKRW